MKRIKLQVGLVIGLGILVLGFQNCSNGASFSANGELVAKSDGGEIVDGGATVPNSGEPTGVTPPAVAPSPTPKPPTASHGGSGGCHNGDRNHDGRHDENDHDSDDDDVVDSDNQYVCVLKGNGSSVRIGLGEHGLQGQVGTPRDVCMTQHACLNILSKKFEVRSAEKRGFCPGKNPHVVSLTDVQIEASLAESEIRTLFNRRK